MLRLSALFISLAGLCSASVQIDLVQWTFENELLSLGTSGDLGPNRVVERPHVIYNDKTSKYVMWMHIDSSNYGEAKAGVATSSSICGDYTYINSVQPLGFQSRDMNVYKDTDGTGYLLTEDRENGLRINKLSADYLTVASNTYKWAEKYESPTIHKSGNTYFMFASQLTGWNPNDNYYSTSTSLSGPWSAWKNFAPVGTNTYSSQTGHVVSINGVVLYMGDRWVSSNLMRSTYVWLPLTITGTTATLNNQVNWILNIAAGTWSPGPSETTPEAESSSNLLSNGAVTQACTSCSGSKSVGYIGGSPGGSLTFRNISSTTATTSTIRIHHANGDASQRYANVIVNGVTYVTSFLPTGGENTPGTSALTVPLKAGTGNTIEFRALGSGWAPDIDRLMVPVS
ncbi:glycosyl hydrolase family 43 protein [Phlyctema vagabunda]|uniref:Glycosyl hydrolase family 43 protein n=1 Tax=Phlyctema vagabunda TaxID=108571 RepID=A0ABR4P437_9HELO